MVERKLILLAQGLLHGNPLGRLRVCPRMRGRQVCPQRQVSHGDDPSARVALRVAVGPELLQVKVRPAHTGLFAKLAPSGLIECLAVADVATRECRRAQERLLAPLDQQDLELSLPDGEDRQVDRHRDRDNRGHRAKPVGHRLTY